MYKMSSWRRDELLQRVHASVYHDSPRLARDVRMLLARDGARAITPLRELARVYRALEPERTARALHCLERAVARVK